MKNAFSFRLYRRELDALEEEYKASAAAASGFQ
jgi:hypothetical protein